MPLKNISRKYPESGNMLSNICQPQGDSSVIGPMPELQTNWSSLRRIVYRRLMWLHGVIGQKRKKKWLEVQHEHLGPDIENQTGKLEKLDQPSLGDSRHSRRMACTLHICHKGLSLTSWRARALIDWSAPKLFQEKSTGFGGWFTQGLGSLPTINGLVDSCLWYSAESERYLDAAHIFFHGNIITKYMV